MYMYAHSCLKPLSNEQNSTSKHEIYVLLNNTKNEPELLPKK